MVQYNGPERLRMRLQEEWIRYIVRQELIRVLADLASGATEIQSGGPALNHPAGAEAVRLAATAAIEKIKERTEHEHTRRHGR